MKSMVVKKRDQTGAMWMYFGPLGFLTRSDFGGSNMMVAAWRGGTRVAARRVARDDSNTARCL